MARQELVTIERVGYAESKLKGTPSCECKLSNGMYFHFYMSESAIERSCSRMRDLGWTGFGIDTWSELEGKQALATIEFEEYNGVSTEKVKWLNAPSAVGATVGRGPSDSRCRALLDAKLAALARKEPIANVTMPTAKENDDLPF